MEDSEGGGDNGAETVTVVAGFKSLPKYEHRGL